MVTKRPVAPRPKNLNLMSIRLPVPAVVSILHRVSGFLLFLVIPALLLTFQASLQSPESFEQVAQILHHPLARLLQLGLIAAFAHHFFAGLRHLAMDMHWGTPLVQARLTAKLVLVLDVLAVMIAACWLW